MTRSRAVFGFVLALLCFATTFVEAAERRRALVIGNSKYEALESLPNARNDAARVAESLKAIGFEVTVVYDLTRQGFSEALSKFARDVPQDVTASLIYYAGHAVQTDDGNFVVPVDARLFSKVDVNLQAVNVASLQDVLRTTRGARLLILDGCRNDPTLQNNNSSIRLGFSRINALDNQFIAYSTQSGNQAADGVTGNSPFTASFLKFVGEAGLNISEVFQKVKQDVAVTTMNQQVPEISDSLIQPFVFVPKKPVEEPVAKQGPSLVDLALAYNEFKDDAALLADFAAKEGEHFTPSFRSKVDDRIKELAKAAALKQEAKATAEAVAATATEVEPSSVASPLFKNAQAELVRLGCLKMPSPTGVLDRATLDSVKLAYSYLKVVNRSASPIPFVDGALSPAFVEGLGQAPAPLCVREAALQSETGTMQDGGQAVADPKAEFDAAAKVGTAEAYKSFLRYHPKGLYADLAQQALAKIEENRSVKIDVAEQSAAPQGAPPPDAPLEQVYWWTIRDSVLVTDFEGYLNRYPHGAFADLAKARVLALSRAAEVNELAGPEGDKAVLRRAAMAQVDRIPVNLVQYGLIALGFQVENVTGVLDRSTKEAIRGYQSSISETQSGKLTPQQTVNLLLAAASVGDAHAQTAVGIMTAQGLGLQQDYSAARVWFERARRQGDPYASVNLGLLVRDGLGGPQNIDHARALFAEAAAKGLKEARSNLDALGVQ